MSAANVRREAGNIGSPVKVADYAGNKYARLFRRFHGSFRYYLTSAEDNTVSRRVDVIAAFIKI